MRYKVDLEIKIKPEYSKEPTATNIQFWQAFASAAIGEMVSVEEHNIEQYENSLKS